MLFAVLDDGPGGPIPSSRSILTSGSQNITPLQIQAQPSHPWKIYSYSIYCQLWLEIGALGNYPSYGRLWQLKGGFIPNAEDAQTNGESFLSIPRSALPFVTTIWDGSADPTPPNAPGGLLPTGLIVSATEQLPQPVSIDPTQRAAFGLWLLPTIIANTAIVITEANYQITYDDGF